MIREVFEETGLMCRIIDCSYPTKTKIQNTDHVSVLPIPFAILKEFIIDSKQGNHWHIDMVYLCELITSEKKPSDEFKWIPFEELARLNIPSDLLQLASMVNESNLLK